ncbi:MAG TPA: CHAT domain-containing protein [Candidatus Obscuribacterales bacterium]
MNVEIKDPVAEMQARDLSKRLAPDEAFVNILYYTREKDNARCYAAIVLRNGAEVPRFVDLGVAEPPEHGGSRTPKGKASGPGNPQQIVVAASGKGSRDAIPFTEETSMILSAPQSIEDAVKLWRYAVTHNGLELAGRGESRELEIGREKPSKEPARARENILTQAQQYLQGRVLVPIWQALGLPNNTNTSSSGKVADGGVTSSSAEKMGAAVRRLWVCPDGELARVPLHVLIDEFSGGAVMACEVDSPRELVALRAAANEPAQPSDKLLLAAVRDFGGRASRLNNTLTEIEKIEKLAAAPNLGLSAIPLKESDATRDAVLRVLKEGKVGYAHIATHGFAGEELRKMNAGAARQRDKAVASAAGGSRFNEKNEGRSNVQPDSQTRTLRLIARDSSGGVDHMYVARSPLLDSGLLLALPADAQAKKKDEADKDPGVVTAEDLVGLNLTGCNLVTLSACETGLGEGKTGQGILGLRSAIMGAGSRAILMSLWKVDDPATAVLMKHFYTNLWAKGMQPAEALRQAQIEVRKRWPDPQYWAAWVLVGQGWK